MLLSHESIAERLAAAQTPDALKGIWQGVIERLGFRTFDYASGRLLTARPTSALDLQPDWYLATREWTGQYFERGYATVDRGTLHSLTHITPWSYADVLWAAPTGHPLEREMHGEIRAGGIRSGLGIPLHGPAGRVAVMDLGSDLVPEDFARLDREVRPLAVLLSSMFHERAIALLAPAQPETLSLTRRERECLMWVSQGKTSWEIGEVLGIAESTVNNTLTSARMKLGVATRSQAVAKAMAWKLL